jgi:transcriptional regulator with XRE-family HTH domain
MNGKRLDELMKGLGVTQIQFADKLGVSTQAITNWKSRDIGSSAFQKIMLAFPDVNANWLMTGMGEMLNKRVDFRYTRKENLSGFPSNAIPSIEVTDYEFAGENKNDGLFFTDQDGVLRMSVPHVPFAARAEFPNLADNLEQHLEGWSREMYVVDKKVNGKYLSFDVLGDSMDNGTRECLQDGDKVLVRELERDFWRDLRLDHRYWVIVFGASVLIKEIVSEDRDNGQIVCHSLNPSPEYHDFTLSLDDVRCLYYVVKIKPKERSV